MVRCIFATVFFSVVIYSVTGRSVVSQAAETSRPDVSPYLREAYFAAVEGDLALRERLLIAAEETAPELNEVHWRSGELLVDGEWTTIADVQAAAADDPRIARYKGLLTAADDSPAAQLALARWCRRARLTDEARVHWQNVLAVDRRHPEALRALKLRVVDGAHVAVENLSNRREQDQANILAQRRWTTTVRTWQRAYKTGDTSERDDLLAQVAQLADPLSIDALEEWTLPEWAGGENARGNEDAAVAFVIALSNMSDEAATETLVRHALASSHATVREAAGHSLSERSFYEFVPDLLDLMEQPIESRWGVNWDGNGNVIYAHSLFQRGAFVDRELANQQALDQVDMNPVPRPSFDPVLQRIATVANTATRSYGRQAERVEAQVEATNRMIESRNDRIAELLRAATGEPYDGDPDQWWDWWTQYTSVELASSRPVERSVSTQIRAEVYAPEAPSIPGAMVVRASGSGVPIPTYECFVAGTPVWTKTGLVPIERLSAGDLVLSQDTATGELAFRAIVRRTVRDPSPAMHLRCGSETITATIGHPFFKLGEGWTMVKQLAPGDVISGATQPTKIDSVEPAGDVEAHNLIVDGFASYFVGNTGMLVHDGTPTPSVREVEPGLRLEQ